MGSSRWSDSDFGCHRLMHIRFAESAFWAALGRAMRGFPMVGAGWQFDALFCIV